ERSEGCQDAKPNATGGPSPSEPALNERGTRVERAAQDDDVAPFFLGAANILRRSKRFFPRTGFQRSPTLRTRSRTLSILKSSMRTPSSISSHFTGVETEATGVGRIE